MYGRDYADRVLSFEPSGGLLHYTLVMQDRETDSYWSIMTGDALAGDLRGTELVELPVGTKSRWGDWRSEHPDTRVLSVDGTEHVENNSYENYFASDKGFRNSVAEDDRLPTKTPIFAFRRNGKAYAVPHERFEGGRAFKVGKEFIFLYRPADASLFQSTVAFLSSGNGFSGQAGSWRDLATCGTFDASTAGFEGVEDRGPQALDGFDTFWFNWSMTHPKTKILHPIKP